MRLYYSDHFVLPLPEGHRFPMRKYRMLRELVTQFPHISLEEAPLVTRDQLLLAHDSEYIDRVFGGELSASEEREIGFPWSEQMVTRSLRASGATVAALHTAWSEGVSANLAGGTHHAYRGKGSGFCVFNDSAIAAKSFQKNYSRILGRIPQVLILDLDVHQGNGTAEICYGDDSIFTCSIHGEKNFPFRKELSDLDIGLQDNCSDAEYLERLTNALIQIQNRFNPDIMIYLAGADPYIGDRLGRLSLSKKGLFERDKMVFDWAKNFHLPMAITMGGGYGEVIEDTVSIHAQTIQLAQSYQW